MHVPLVICAHPSPWWHTLYWGNVLMVYFVHIPPHVDPNSISTSSSYLLCTLGNFTAYFVYLLLDEHNFLWVIFLAYMCTLLRWSILFINIHPLSDLFCAHRNFDGFVCPCWPIFCIYHLFMTRFCTVMTFKVYFVYFLKLGELISRDILRLRDRPSGDLICTHTSS